MSGWKNSSKKVFLFFKSKLFYSILFFFSFLIFLFSFNFFIVNYDQQLWKGKDGFLVVKSLPNSEKDLSFVQQAVEAVCENFDKEYQTGEPCDLSNQSFRSHGGYVYYGTSSSDLTLFEGVLDSYKSSGFKNFVLPSFDFQVFIKKYIYELEKLGINIIAVDTFFAPEEGRDWPKNLWQFTFNQAFAGYHAGIYAASYALMNPEKFKDGDGDSSNGKEIRFASIGGKNISPIFFYALGFALGTSIVNENRAAFLPGDLNEDDVQIVHHAYKEIGGFSQVENKTTAKTFANNLYGEEGVSVIFSIAGGLSLAIASSAQEADSRHSGSKRHYAIGVDVDQGYSYNDESLDVIDESSTFLTSAIIGIRREVASRMDEIQRGETPTQGEMVDAHFDENGAPIASLPKRFLDSPTWAKAKQVLGESMNFANLKVNGTRAGNINRSREAIDAISKEARTLFSRDRKNSEVYYKQIIETLVKSTYASDESRRTRAVERITEDLLANRNNSDFKNDLVRFANNLG